MGAHELNYSSDIDVIMLFDGEAYGADFQDARAALVRATRKMAGMLSDITDSGYVFRTDLRLRPDASVTPVCLSTAAAETYYESVGRTWERAAYIKARAAAGDTKGGQEFLKRLSPFVWRKHLDFAAIQDAHDMRLRIREHKGLHGPITLPGHNMKLGRGGIREIEFFTQTRQLIAGGRDKDLRARGTVEGLSALAKKDWIPSDLAETLTTAYRDHREVEHRLQMIADAQTHDLPGSDAGFARLAAFMGQDGTTLRHDIRQRLEQVHALTESFFAPGDAAPTVAAPEGSEATIASWHSYPALRSDRAMQIFERLKPDLLARLSKAAKPSEALEQFDQFLAGLPAGVQVFSLFEANPLLIDLIVDIAATAPALARYLGRNAQVFDAVIGGSFFEPWPEPAALTDNLRAALSGVDDYETQLDTARLWHKEWHFRIGVHYLRGLIDATEAGLHYAQLAESILRGLWDVVVAEFARKYGDPPGHGACVLGMGSLGAQQLSATSDLDVIVIYDAAGVEASDGRRSLPARQYYARLTQAFITALSTQTAHGTLYEVDMRLRPSGRQGPVATAFNSFDEYQRTEAWTWEHLALTRARPVAGSTALGDRVEALRQDLLKQPRDWGAICQDVLDMRDRLAQAAGDVSEWSAKRGPGRLQDIELLAQSAALMAGNPARSIADQLATATGVANWLSPETVETVLKEYNWLWALQAANRLLSGASQAFEHLGEGGQTFIFSQTDVQCVEDLRAKLHDVSQSAATVVQSALEHPPKPS